MENYSHIAVRTVPSRNGAYMYGERGGKGMERGGRKGE